MPEGRYNEKKHDPYVKRIVALQESDNLTIESLVAKSHPVALAIRHIIGRKTFLNNEQLQKFIDKNKGIYEPHLTLLDLTIRAVEENDQQKVIQEFIAKRKSDISWINIKVNDFHPDRLSEEFSALKLTGVFSCFYSTRERKIYDGDYIGRVKYVIEDIDHDNGCIVGTYITERSSRKNLNQRIIKMVMSNRARDVFSIFHFAKGVNKTIIYSIVRSYETIDNYRVLYGFTVREGKNEGTFVAFKTIWIPDDLITELGDEYIFPKAIIDRECLDFLEDFFQQNSLKDDYSHLSFAPNSDLGDQIDTYIRQCDGRQLIRLRSDRPATTSNDPVDEVS